MRNTTLERIRRNHAEKIRYIIVGGLNTVLDFCLLFVFVSMGMHRIPANYLSTGISMVVSFFANKSFTFKNTSKQRKRQFALFIVVTVIGMWIIQPIVIWIVSHTLDPYIANKSIELFIAKVFATGASLVWNYMFYSRLVFKKESEK